MNRKKEGRKGGIDMKKNNKRKRINTKSNKIVI